MDNTFGLQHLGCIFSLENYPQHEQWKKLISMAKKWIHKDTFVDYIDKKWKIWGKLCFTIINYIISLLH
jgi:hypothetical protein